VRHHDSRSWTGPYQDDAAIPAEILDGGVPKFLAEFPTVYVNLLNSHLYRGKADILYRRRKTNQYPLSQSPWSNSVLLVATEPDRYAVHHVTHSLRRRRAHSGQRACSGRRIASEEFRGRGNISRGSTARRGRLALVLLHGMLVHELLVGVHSLLRLARVDIPSKAFLRSEPTGVHRGKHRNVQLVVETRSVVDDLHRVMAICISGTRCL
jgi:hypothetical protein